MSNLILCLLLTTLHALSTDANDVLGGNGLFSSSSVNNFALHSSHTISLINYSGTDVLKLEKPSGESVNYENGFSYTFSSCKPVHIQFKFASSNPDIEDTNMRIIDSEGNTLVLFRAGRGGLVRVNQQQMVSFYNSSVSTDSEIKLTQVDLLLNWDDQEIRVFIDEEYKQTCQFFHSQFSNATQVLLYNLYESVSYWQDLVVCTKICYSFNSESYLAGIAAFLLLILALTA